MRFFDTRRIIDSNRSPLTDLYEGRINQQLHRLTVDDIDEPNIMRALLELRTWHLPPLFDVPQAVRARVRSIQEKTLLHPTTPIINTTLCTDCGHPRQTYGQPARCLPCWDILTRSLWVTGSGSAHAQDVAQQLNLPTLDRIHLVASLSDFIQWSHTILRLQPTATHTHAPVDSWSSPKKNFLAMEVGCTHPGCTTKLTHNAETWLYSEDSENWSEGLCESHARQTSYPAHYIWGMHPATYQEWQQSYTAPIKLHRTAQRYGAIALLLVSQEYHWVKLLSQLLPILPAAQPKERVLANIIGSIHTRPKTLLEVYKNVPR